MFNIPQVFRNINGYLLSFLILEIVKKWSWSKIGFFLYMYVEFI